MLQKNPELYVNDPDYRYVLTFKKSSKRENGYIVKKIIYHTMNF
jgi:hypothetical protein